MRRQVATTRRASSWANDTDTYPEDSFDFGWKARDFALKGVDGKTYSLAEIRGPKGTLVVFICNHCPYATISLFLT